MHDKTRRKIPSVLDQVRSNKDNWTERIEHMEVVIRFVIRFLFIIKLDWSVYTC